MKSYSTTFPMSLGRLYRDEAIYQLKSAAMLRNIDFQFVENRGWLSSDYRVRITGEFVTVCQYMNDIQIWVSKMS
jgi:hypothetical protein